jgi:hypothetical protein
MPDASDGPPPASRREPGPRARLLVLVAGLVLAQVLLYGPSLIGRRILLPLDVLALPGVYLPEGPETARIRPQNPKLSDLVFQFEPQRRFVGAELRAGRLPLWAPYQYCGVPIVWPKFSPLLLLGALVASPVVLAWQQLLTALVAGIGMYAFARRTLGVGFWPAAVAGWCFPLSGFLVLWLGFPTVGALPWLPWLLVAVERAVSRGGAGGALGVGAATALVLVAGHIDVNAQVLLVAGLYAAVRLIGLHRGRWLGARNAVLTLAGGGLLGLLVAAPHLLPLLEYARSGARVEERWAGSEERPPIGPAALAEIVLPDLYGSDGTQSLRTLPYNQLEGPSAGYAGLFAALVLAPLAYASRRQRGQALFWGAVVLLGLGWSANLPGWVSLLRLPGLNLLSHNRFVFASSFALLALAALGLEGLASRRLERRLWFGVPAAVALALGTWCASRAVELPEPIATQLRADVLLGTFAYGVEDLGRVAAIQEWFTRSAAIGAGSCFLAVAAWAWIWARPRAAAGVVLAALLLADLLLFAHGRNPQCDPALDYPPLPALSEIARAEPGRVLGFQCLPANLTQVHGLSDVRGYDGIDPKRTLALLNRAADGSGGTPYAPTLLFTPNGQLVPPDGVRLPPILDLLGVRYVIFRGAAPEGTRPLFQSPDYLVYVNRAALPRAFVPRRVAPETEEGARLARLAVPSFDPRELALVESALELPEECQGTATLVSETPTHLELALAMQTSGLVVLTDTWDPGWEARVDGRAVPILRANHALRGVLVGAEARTLEFRYAPVSLARGLLLAALGVAGFVLLGVRARRRSREDAGVASGP